MRISFLLAMGALLINPAGSAPVTNHHLASPDGRLAVDVEVGAVIRYSLTAGGRRLIEPSAISLILADNQNLGTAPVVKDAPVDSVNQTIAPSFYKKATIVDNFNRLLLSFEGQYALEFRAYNGGMAYRFLTNREGTIRVLDEQCEFNFGGDHGVWAQYVNRWGKGDKYYTTFENSYVHVPLSKLVTKDTPIVTPVVVDANGCKLAILEADLEDYAGMFLERGNRDHSLVGTFARRPIKTSISDAKLVAEDNLEAVVGEGDRSDIIAVTKGTRSFPWRAIVVAEKDCDLANNDMVYKLAAPSRIKDMSWIKPGKVAWDWWIECDLWGVDFEAGVNFQTYREYINFASENGLQYILIDVGFSKTNDIMLVNPALRIEELIAFANSKHVGIIAWSGWLAIKDKIEEACAHYAKLGIKGFKVDFMNRDDQEIVNFYYQMAESAAKHHLLLNFHGAYKPTGLQRTWPNVLSFEGVKGQEWCRWTNPDQPKHVVTFPFIRMLAGPVDFTPGVFRSESKERFKPSWIGSMGQGTRAHQMSMYTVFESPLQMLSDSPSRYREQQECTDFIKQVPTVWDETVALDGKIGEFIAVARRSGDTWFIGVLTNWDRRDLMLDLSFLPKGRYQMESFKDGANANRYAQDYRKETTNVEAGEKLKLHLASGGGWTAILVPQRE